MPSNLSAEQSLQKWRERRTSAHIDQLICDYGGELDIGAVEVKLGFISGLSAGEEIGRILGRIETLFEMTGYQHHPRVASELTRKYTESEANLTALLAEGEG